ncbi:unnamed protein product [Cunninghamella blakesleeana]
MILLTNFKVCKRWHYLVYEGSLWQTIDTTPFYDIIPADQILKLALASGTFLKVANFRGCIQLTSNMLRVLSKSCYNTEVLCLKDCRGLSTPSIGCFLKASHHLRILDLSGLESVKNSTLSIIGQQPLNQLEELNINWCRNITGEGIQGLFLLKKKENQEDQEDDNDEYMKKKKESDDKNNNNDNDNDNIRLLPSLKILKINGCKMLDDYTMQLIASKLPNLQQLSLASCTYIKDHTLITFLKHLSTPSTLTHLNLSNCVQLTDKILGPLAKYCPQLTHLELAGCNALTDINIAHFILKSKPPTLTCLDLEDVSNITGHTIKMLADHQPKLKRLCVTNCTLIDDDAIEYLIVKGSCQQLEHLELDGCSINDDCLDKIATHLGYRQQQQKNNISHPSLNRISTSSFDSISSTLPPLSMISTSSISSSISSPIENNHTPFIHHDHSNQQQQQKINQAEEEEEEEEEEIKNQTLLRKKLIIEALDCTNITETGVIDALEKSNGLLCIKSFYSWRDEQQQWQDDIDEDEDDGQQRYHTNFFHNARRFRSTSRSRRHRNRYSPTSTAAGQSRSTGCIVL